MHIGDYTATNEGSRESTATVDLTGGGAAGGDDNHDRDSVSSLPTLEDLIFQAEAARKERMAVSKADQNPTDQEQRRLVHNGSLKDGLSTGNRATGHSAGADTIVLDDDDESDTKLDATSSAADAPDDDRGLGATPTLPPDANDPVPAKPITNGQAQDSVIDSANGSGQNLSGCSVNPNGVDRIDQLQPSTHRQHDRPPSSPTDETAKGPELDTPYTEAPAAAGHIHDVFAEYERMFGADSLTRKSRQPKGQSSSSQHRTNPVRDRSLSYSAQVKNRSAASKEFKITQ